MPQDDQTRSVHKARREFSAVGLSCSVDLIASSGVPILSPEQDIMQAAITVKQAVEEYFVKFGPIVGGEVFFESVVQSLEA